MDNGYAIVSLVDEFGGLDSKALLETPLENTMTDTEQAADNRISRKFRIQKTEGTSANWVNAKSYCDNLTEGGYDNWRLPTQREGMLLFAIGGNENVILGDQSSTGDITSAPIVSQYLYQYEGFTPYSKNETWLGMKASHSPTPGATSYWTMIYYDSRAGEVGIQDEKWSKTVRCVRDEKESWPAIEE